MSESEKMRHGQAFAIQWVVYALQKMNSDIKNNGDVTKILIGDAKSVSESNDLGALSR